MNQLTVTYHYHSGFSIVCGETLLIFDYWRGEKQELPLECSITEEYLTGFREVYVFVSHEHPDHFDPVVFEWCRQRNVTIILAADMPKTPTEPAAVRRMAPGQGAIFSRHVSARAYESTDLGVSFLVNVDGVNIFHAGDLNFWHWREEATLREIDQAETQFKAAVYPLIGEKIDLCFFPVDPRQGQMYDAGANYFIMSVKPRLLIPMHFWGRSDLNAEFARRCRTRDTNILPMTQFGSEVDITVEDDGRMTVQPVRQGADPWKQAHAAPQESLGVLESDDPFNDTDLPIFIDDKE